MPFILLMALSGCRHDAPVEAPAELEIARDPTILHARSNEWANMQLRGIRLGAPDEVLQGKRIVSRNDAGWVELRNGARYLIRGGKVNGLGVWDQRLLAKLEINSPADVEAKFGKPDSTDDLGREKIYRYQNDHLRVMWNDFERRVTTVNVVQ
jgi:hypothetical protein